jgi:hypothetical protein
MTLGSKAEIRRSRPIKLPAAFSALAASMWGQAALVSVSLLVLAAIVLGPYVPRGGFAYDDYEQQAMTHFLGFSHSFSLFLSLDSRRPLTALYTAIVGTVFGQHQHWQLAFVACIHVATALTVWFVLRELRTSLLTASASAALVLLYPFSDSVWLWVAGGQVGAAVLLWLLALYLALRGLRVPAGGWKLHTVAAAGYAACVLMYEASLLVCALSGCLYLLRAPPRVALKRWGADLAAIALAVLLFTSMLIRPTGSADLHQLEGLGYTLDHIRIIVVQGQTLGATSMVPFGAPHRWLLTAVVLAVVCAAAAVVVWTRDRQLSRDLSALLALAVGGFVIAVAGWAMFAPADTWYSPGTLGVGNRVNAIAGIGITIFIVAFVQLSVALVLSVNATARAKAGTLVSIVLLAAIGAGYLRDVGSDRGAWIRSATARYALLRKLRRDLSPPPPGSTLVVTGFPLWEAPGVPIFGASWDLTGASQLMWNDYSLKAWPAPPGSITCVPSGVGVTSISEPAPYASAILVNVASGSTTRITSETRCRHLARVATRSS